MCLRLRLQTALETIINGFGYSYCAYFPGYMTVV